MLVAWSPTADGPGEAAKGGGDGNAGAHAAAARACATDGAAASSGQRGVDKRRGGNEGNKKIPPELQEERRKNTAVRGTNGSETPDGRPPPRAFGGNSSVFGGNSSAAYGWNSSACGGNSSNKGGPCLSSLQPLEGGAGYELQGNHRKQTLTVEAVVLDKHHNNDQRHKRSRR